MFSLIKRRLRGDMIAMFKYLKGCPFKKGTGLFSMAPDTRTRSNGFKLQEKRFHLNLELPDSQSWSAVEYAALECGGISFFGGF